MDLLYPQGLMQPGAKDPPHKDLLESAEGVGDARDEYWPINARWKEQRPTEGTGEGRERMGRGGGSSTF